MVIENELYFNTKQHLINIIKKIKWSLSKLQQILLMLFIHDTNERCKTQLQCILHSK